MKYLILFFVLSFGSMNIYAQKEKDAGKKTELPPKILDYLKVSFPEYKILKYEMEKEDGKSTFDVYLDKYVVLDFDTEHNIKGIDGMSKLPDSAIQPKVLDYIKANYSGSSIVDWEINNNIQQITLDNGFELKFNKEGDIQTNKK